MILKSDTKYESIDALYNVLLKLTDLYGVKIGDYTYSIDGNKVVYYKNGKPFAECYLSVCYIATVCKFINNEEEK